MPIRRCSCPVFVRLHNPRCHPVTNNNGGLNIDTVKTYENGSIKNVT